MAIKDPLMFITIEEFKSWNGFNKLEFDEITTPDSEIFKAISIASNNIDYLSGFTISPKWPEITITDFTDEIQTATAYYVNFLLTKDVNYLRGQASISQGGITYSENNPDDPYFIVPEVFSCLRKIKHYLTFKGFPLNVSPNKGNSFMGNGGNENILEEYVKINLLKSSDSRVEIKKIHQKNINGVIIDIDTRGIKTDIDNSLWQVDKDNPNFIEPKDDKGISANGRRLIDVGTPTFLTDATNKQYVDNLLDKKQDKLIVGENIKIDENNKISATGGKVDLTNYYKKEEVDKKLKEIEEKFPTIPQWKEVGTIASNYSQVNYNFKVNKLYRLSYTWKAIDIKKTVIQYLNFYVKAENVEFTILAKIYQSNNANLRLCMSNNLIAVLNAKDEKVENCLYKLEELQE